MKQSWKRKQRGIGGVAAGAAARGGCGDKSIKKKEKKKAAVIPHSDLTLEWLHSIQPGGGGEGAKETRVCKHGRHRRGKRGNKRETSSSATLNDKQLQCKTSTRTLLAGMLTGETEHEHSC